jgi:hypothetical protein
MSSLNLLKRKGDIVTRVRGHLSVHWKDKPDVYVPTNMHTSPLGGNFRDEAGHAVKPHVVEDYNAHMGFVDKSDKMVKISMWDLILQSREANITVRGQVHLRPS